MVFWASPSHSPAAFSTNIVCIVVFVLAFSQFAAAQISNSAPAAEIDLNKPFEGKVGAGKKQRVEISLAAGQYAVFHIESATLKLGITQIRPAGDTVAIFGFTNLTQDAKFGFVAETAGKYQLEIYTTSRSPEGDFRITLTDVRAATELEKGLQSARDLLKKGLALLAEGKNTEARAVILQGIELRSKLSGPENDGVAEGLSFLSMSYLNSGDYVSAIDAKTRSLKIIEKLHGPDDPEVAQINFEIGACYIQKGDYSVGETYFLKSADILKRIDKLDSVVGSFDLAMLGEIAYDRQELEKAGDLFRRALAVNEKLFGPDHYHLVGILENIGAVALEAGDIPTAESVTKRALAITEKQYGTDDWRDTLPLNDLGRIYCKSGNFAKAEEAFGRAYAIQKKLGEGHSSLWVETVAGLARVYAAQGMMSKALTLQTQASEGEEKFIESNLAAGSEREKLAFLATLSPLISQNVSFHQQLARDDPAFRDLALTTILRRKGRLLDFIAYGNKAALARLSVDERKLIDQFNDVTAKLSSLVLSGPENITVEEFQQQVKDLESRREQMEIDINNRNIKYFKRIKPATIDDIRRSIPADSALAEFAVYRPYDPQNDTYSDPRYAVYVLRNTGDIGWRDLGSAHDIDSAAAAFRLALRDPKRSDVRKLGRALDEKIMRPVRQLTGDASHLLISPDGELNVIPFDALVDEDGHYQVERYTFTNLSSGRDLLRRTAEKSESGRPPLVIGNPAFGPSSMGIPDPAKGRRPRAGVINSRDITDTFFAPLSGTEQEARAIKALLPEARYLTGAEATETSLKQASAPKILHIATHGFFLEDNTGSGRRMKAQSLLPTNIDDPLLRSGLALAGANRRGSGDDDGLLTALEASGLDLWGTQLVVLSACDTGLGEIRNGEGVYGLRRAFGIAGAESIVMSLWPVNDRITRDIMISYYQYLKRGTGRSDALRRVRLEMLKRPGRSHPFYWASFIQSGDWTPVR